MVSKKEKKAILPALLACFHLEHATQANFWVILGDSLPSLLPETPLWSSRVQLLGVTPGHLWILSEIGAIGTLYRRQDAKLEMVRKPKRTG